MHRHKVGFGAWVFFAYVIKFEQRLDGFGIKSDIYFATQTATLSWIRLLV